MVATCTRHEPHHMDRSLEHRVSEEESTYPMTTKLHHQVKEFHQAMQLHDQDRDTVGLPPDDVIRLRSRLIIEEAFEFLEACFECNDAGYFTMLKDITKKLISRSHIHVSLPEAMDALADLDYVSEGTRLSFGVDGEPLADEVHRSNMQKCGGGRDEHGKVKKPEGWKSPNIEKCLMDQGWEKDT